MHTNLARIYRREAKSNNRDYPLVKPATGSTFFSHLTGKFQIPRSKSTHKEHQNFVQDAITLLYDLTLSQNLSEYGDSHPTCRRHSPYSL